MWGNPYLPLYFVWRCVFGVLEGLFVFLVVDDSSSACFYGAAGLFHIHIFPDFFSKINDAFWLLLYYIYLVKLLN